MAEEVEMDQEVYDKLIADGKSERIARAKAKAAAVRAKKKAAGAELGPKSFEEQKAAAEAAGGGASGGGGGTATAVAEAPEAGGMMSAEERQKRVAEALKRKQGKVADLQQPEAKLAGQKHTHRLLAMVPPSGIQQIKGKQEDKVYTWPHLLSSELVCLLAVTAALLLISITPAFPLRELANPNQTPNPSKAPWYFLGLQELLRYFHPMIAGVTIPGIVGLGGLMAIPYLDKNPSVKPENRKFATVLMSMFLLGSTILTLVGSFFRGPGFNWVWPWVDGLFFEI
ncbi:menaquinol-cytochrome c reductase cytochrome b subunit [Euzebya tangerina]|uniref:menaquinol-cytochrome c reductase cytochrome b subunit n=1 Tax=Euzebya tangerina TaxID=591198 RepID=UPI000E324B92|nr:menaquinol-cytochrome c reductase cytochrome b subunit [Euzebya tangerina]